MLLTDYDAVRTALDIGLTADDLPDSLIQTSVAAREAEAEVRRRVPNVDTRPTAERRRAIDACALLTAAFLAPAVPRIVRQVVTDMDEQRQLLPTAEHVAELRRQADLILATLVYATPDATAAAYLPPLFGRASAPCRSRAY